jgi:TolB-like protein
VQIAKLRRILDQNRERGSCIQTIPGRGYSFVGVLRPTDVAARSALPEVSRAGELPRLSIVVLPFLNLSNDWRQESFAHAVIEDLTTDLSRIAGSFVIAPNTAFTYKSKSIGTTQIGRELGVQYVLEGSVREIGDQIRVNAQLIDAESGAHLWADLFDTDRTDLTAAQNEIVGRLAQSLNLEFAQMAGRRIEQEDTIGADPEALIKHGWAWYYRPTSGATVEAAQRAFERALMIDRGSGDARIGTATVLVRKTLTDSARSGPCPMPLVRRPEFVACPLMCQI